jgi:hypothetical protein
MRLHLSRGLLLLAAALLVAACGGGEAQPAATTTPSQIGPVATATPGQIGPVATPTPGQNGPTATTTSGQDLFVNPGFENGIDPWFSIANDVAWGTPVQASAAEAHSGKQSALLQMRAGNNDTGAKVFGAVQEITPKEFPELISGYYRVDSWVRGTPKQYIQFVVIVFNPGGLPTTFPNFQIRYPLAGIDQEPFAIFNAHFVFISKDQPVIGRWVYFEHNIRDDFKQLWGAVPTSFDKIRILFEARYDDKAAGSGEISADVYYDDLYVGTAAGNPNHP